MMSVLGWVLYASAAVPTLVAIRATRGTSLFHSVVWACLAWMTWGVALTAGDPDWDYAALCMTGCVGVAVFGARRPAVPAWDFVVGTLLDVLVLPVGEGPIAGK